MSKKVRIKEDILPVELILRIQSLLPLKEAASTCILSKSWLQAWYTIPTLKLIPPDPDEWFSTFENATKYNKLIHTTLQRYHRDNIPIESFHLSLNIEENYLNLVDVKNWIRLAVSNSCLKDLSLNINFFVEESLTLPNELFSSQNLHTINVTATTDDFYIPLPVQICNNPPAINCVSLRVLDLDQVVITENLFHNLLSICTLLEKIKLSWCEGLKHVKVKNLLRLSELDILLTEWDDLLEINNVPSLCSFRYRSEFAQMKHIPFQIDSLASVTQLCIEGVILDDSFFNTLRSKFSVLESLTLRINYRELGNMAITSVSLKWLSLSLCQSGPAINVQVFAPRLLSFVYSGNIPGLLFRTTAPEQVKLCLTSTEDLGHSFFLKMREILNASSKFDIYIGHDILYRLVPLNIDVDDLKRRVLFPVGNVNRLTLATGSDEDAWEKSRFFDAFFLICHPSYIGSSYKVIRKMMEGNTTDLKEVQLKNRHNGNWEALTTSWESVLHTLTGHLECKLIWFPQYIHGKEGVLSGPAEAHLRREAAQGWTYPC